MEGAAVQTYCQNWQFSLSPTSVRIPANAPEKPKRMFAAPNEKFFRVGLGSNRLLLGEIVSGSHVLTPEFFSQLFPVKEYIPWGDYSVVVSEKTHRLSISLVSEQS